MGYSSPYRYWGTFVATILHHVQVLDKLLVPNSLVVEFNSIRFHRHVVRLCNTGYRAAGTPPL